MLSGMHSDDGSLQLIEVELESISREIAHLRARQQQLRHRRDGIVEARAANDRRLRESLEPDWTSNSVFPWSSRLTQAARDTFGFSHLRPSQLQAMNASLSGYDVLAVMKTGGGKSLCFQLPALIREDGFSLVVCPLIALIRDQVMGINKILPGAACSLTGQMDRVEQSDVYKSISLSTNQSSRMRLLYTTPEKIVKSKLLMTHLQRAYERGHLGSIVVDEAHCASQWGHDFRPDYAKLHILRTVFPSVPMLLLTATANSSVRRDVTEMLQLGLAPLEGPEPSKHAIQGLKTFLGDFDRPNLKFEVWTKPATFKASMDLVRSVVPTGFEGNVIVYCFSQQECMQVSDALKTLGLAAAPYHAGLTDDFRDGVQDAWVAGRIQVICATIAFGLGINMPKVRLVLHFTISKSLELYYQEAGRAGRDGLPAKCILLYSPEDVLRIAGMAVDDVERLPSNRGGGTQPKVLGMIRYAQSKLCRRECFARSLNADDTILKYGTQTSMRSCSIATETDSPAAHFDAASPTEYCDNCRKRSTSSDTSPSLIADVCAMTAAIKSCIEKAAAAVESGGGMLTMKKIVAATNVKQAAKNCKATIGAAEIEYIIAGLLSKGALSIQYNFTPYKTLCYLKMGYAFHIDVLDDSYISSYLLLPPPIPRVSATSICGEEDGGELSYPKGSNSDSDSSFVPRGKRLQKELSEAAVRKKKKQGHVHSSMDVESHADNADSDEYNAAVEVMKSNHPLSSSSSDRAPRGTGRVKQTAGTISTSSSSAVIDLTK